MRIYLSDLISNINNNVIIIYIFYIYQNKEKSNKRNEMKDFPFVILF